MRPSRPWSWPSRARSGAGSALPHESRRMCRRRPDRPIRLEPGDARSGPRPYVLVREGLEALILRPVFYEA